MGRWTRAWAWLSGLPAGAPLDVCVLTFAAWTVATNLVVITAGNSNALALAGLASLVLVAAAVTAIARNPGLRTAYLTDLADEPIAAAPSGAPKSGLVALALGAVSLLTWTTTHNPWLAWVALAGASLLLAFTALRTQNTATPPMDRAPSSRMPFDVELVVTHVLAAIAAIVTLLVVRPRSDGTFYLNMAVSIVDFPEQALLSVKNLHGAPSATLGPQPMFPPYKVHSFEALGGAIARATGLSAAQVVHLWMAPLFSWLTPFALRRLLRLVAPRDVVLGLCVIVSFYCIEGSASRGYANHAFVRMFDGKSVLLTVALPLICAYGLRFGARPTGFRFALLMLAQIAGVGLSSTGLWLVPTVAMLATLAGAPNIRSWPARAAGSVGSSLYVLAIALWVMSQMKTGVADPGEADGAAEGLGVVAREAADKIPARFRDLVESFPVVLGPSHTAVMLLGAVLIGTLLAPTTLALRLLAALVLVLVIGFANPWLARSLARSVTGAVTYHRVFWLLPVPLTVAFAVAGLVRSLRTRVAPALVLPLAAAALSAFYVATVDRLVISSDNEANIVFPPTLKLPSMGLAAASELCKWAPAGTHVLAPLFVAQQLPTLHHCGAPLIAGDRWLTAPLKERNARLAMLPPIDKGADVPKEQAAQYGDQVDHYAIDAVFLAKESARNSRVKSLLRMRGFERATAFEWHQIYARARPTTLAQMDLVARMACKLAKGRAVLAPFGVARALDARRCVRNVASPRGMQGLSPDDADEVMRMERLTFIAGDLPASQTKWLVEALIRRSVSLVVLGPMTSQSAQLKRALESLGMRRARILQGHNFYLRDEDAPSDPD